jgi:ribosomal protein S18 acetylase RimI-like enzyme
MTAMSDVALRPARSEDVDRVSDIINDPPGRAAVHVAGSTAKAIEGGRVLCRLGISLQIQHTTVAEADGMIVGMMDACPNRADPEFGPAMILRSIVPVVQAIGIGGLWRLLRNRAAFSRMSFDQVTDSYYIAELNVDAGFRNRGIGATLLRHGEKLAHEADCASMSLTTTTTNPAQHLYERFGFKVVDTRLDAAYERLSGSPGRVLMIKDLKSAP